MFLEASHKANPGCVAHWSGSTFLPTTVVLKTGNVLHSPPLLWHRSSLIQTTKNKLKLNNGEYGNYRNCKKKRRKKNINQSCSNKMAIGDVGFWTSNSPGLASPRGQAKLLWRVWQLIQDWLGSILDRFHRPLAKIFELHLMYRKHRNTMAWILTRIHWFLIIVKFS